MKDAFKVLDYVVICFLSCILLVILYNIMDIFLYNDVYQPISSYVKDTGIEGRFTFGSGVIKDKQLFVVYEKNLNGSLKLVEYDADDTDLFAILKKGEQPYAVYENHYLTSDKRNVKLFVPKDSVQKIYNGTLDSQNNSQ